MVSFGLSNVARYTNHEVKSCLYATVVYDTAVAVKLGFGDIYELSFT